MGVARDRTDESRFWTANEILDTLEFTSLTTFKIFPRRETPLYKSRTGGRKGAVFETDCIYVEGHYEHLKDWISENYRENELESCQDIESASVKGEKCLGEDVHTIEEVMCGTQTPKSKRRCLRSEKLLHSDTGKDTEEMCLLDRSNPNPLLEYPRSQYWVYADYKYLCNIHRDSPEKTFSEVDWSIFGLGEQDWKDSVLWIGSEGAYTPCHYDTYGYNLVAQLAGEKKWTLFSPSDSVNLYPTRVPYEESSVFSEVDVVDPDYVQYPRHRDATPYQVRSDHMLYAVFYRQMVLYLLKEMGNAYILLDIAKNRSLQPPEMRTPLYTVELLYSNPLK